MCQPEAGLVMSLPLMPEWWLLVAALAGLGLLGLAWAPLLWAWPLFLIAVMAPVAQALKSGFSAKIETTGRSRLELLKLRLLITWFHLIQPIARLRGRIRFGLTPWRLPSAPQLALPVWRTTWDWSETWREPGSVLAEVTSRLRQHNAPISFGDDFARWDIEVRGGLLGGTHVLAAFEHHDGGKQLVRYRLSPFAFTLARFVIGILVVLGTWAFMSGAMVAGTVLATAALAFVARLGVEISVAHGTVFEALKVAD
jgi:membrane protein implicated in regulation of membrane protease activity